MVTIYHKMQNENEINEIIEKARVKEDCINLIFIWKSLKGETI